MRSVYGDEIFEDVVGEGFTLLSFCGRGDAEREGERVKGDECCGRGEEREEARREEEEPEDWAVETRGYDIRDDADYGGDQVPPEEEVKAPF